MNYNRPKNNSSTIGIRLMCAIVFLTFSFVWLYHFQADLLAAAQHVLSGGLTTYNRVLAPVVITVLLQLLQLGVYTLFRLKKRTHALTYLPSMLLLALLTDISPTIAEGHSLGAWWWLLPLLLVVWAGVALLVRALQDVEPVNESCGLFSRPMWINMLLMLLMIICVASISNSNAVFHYRMKAEACLLEGNNEGALDAGWESLESDANLQMVRMYALSRKGELGERLFRYPIVAGSSAMLPTNGESSTILYPIDSLYRYFGARPAAPMLPVRYLQLMARRDTVVSQKLVDYELCGLLIDKKIDQFVGRIRHYYPELDSVGADRLPRHYREALTLYTHLRSNPIVIYHNAVMDEDWDNLQELEALYTDPSERKGRVEEQYRGTYWYYYEYE
jgi:hypothetical protein